MLPPVQQECGSVRDQLNVLQQKHHKLSIEANQKQRLVEQLRGEVGERQAEISRIKPLLQPAKDLKAVDGSAPTVYAVTPTYARYTQKADLTRLSQTFLHIRHFHWILVEDSKTKTPLVTRFLQRSGLNYTHLAVSTPEQRKLKENEPRWHKARGVEQRNLAIEWVVKNRATSVGVVYFADDDNTYDLRIFEQVYCSIYHFCVFLNSFVVCRCVLHVGFPSGQLD